ncbi:hypothetical protein CERZMDRAFT_95563 [Cercospora zeae-maydis SCOH1-5]|uniref:Sulfotransferase domain-containing protein n=1 Tax=Cercospora zeae-maydis SCOH1-5 TaxID=717836 RepID=A0A6A6FLF0_9PEZI|nr:hypothetical protein CERZMDRAFT_95563 [Cercospora zeae-maydis SCOH1-5]
MSIGDEATARNSTQQRGPRRSMLITIPRTCSNLLVKILALDQQDNVKHGSYHFIGAMVHHANEHTIDNAPETWTDEQKLAFHELYAECISRLEEDIRLDNDAQVGFTKEHCGTFMEPTAISRFVNGVSENGEPPAAPLRWSIPGYESLYSERNGTVLPDAYLLTWRPIFLIRHPIRVFESTLRNMTDVFNECADGITGNCTETSKQATIHSQSTFTFQRSLYDFYVSHGVRPIVIDADDLIVNTKAITQKLALQIGLDPEKLAYYWDPASAEEVKNRETHMRIMLTTLDTSSGIVTDKLGATAGSPEEMMPAWAEAFGEKKAQYLREKVEKELPDYEYLCNRRMMV